MITSIKQQIKSPSPIPVYAHMMAWFGSHTHPKVNYRSDDPCTIARQLDELKAWGVDGITVDWYGDFAYQHRLINRATALYLQACAARGMSLGVCIDIGAVTSRPDKSVSTTNAFIDLMQGVLAFYTQSPAYMTIDGKPVVFEFGMETLSDKGETPIDWNAVVAKFPSVLFVHRNIGGFTTPGAGSYSWIDSGLSYLADYYARALAPSQSKLCFGSLFTGFDNHKLNSDGTYVQPEAPVWGTLKVIDQRQGQTWLDTIAAANEFIAKGGKLAGLQIATYNDWEEGSAVEGGISTGVKVVGNLNGLQSLPPAFEFLPVLKA